MSSAPPNILLSVEYLHDLKRDMEDAAARAVMAQAESAALRRKLNAAAELLGVDVEQLPPLPTPLSVPVRKPAAIEKPVKPAPVKRKLPRAPNGGWLKAIIEILETENRGRPHAALYSALEISDFAKTTKVNLKRYYTTIARMQKNGQVVRAGVLLYAPSVATRLRKVGPLPDRDLEQRQLFNNKVQTPSLIERILIENQQGLEGPALVGLLGAMPEAPESVRTHPHFVYTTLSNMIRKGTIYRDGNLYRLIENRNGPVARTTDPLH